VFLKQYIGENNARFQLSSTIATSTLFTMSRNQKVGSETATPLVVENNGDDLPVLSDRFADESYKLFQKLQVTDPTPEEARRIRNKCLWRILPFLCIGYHLMYVDKQTVSFYIVLCKAFYQLICCVSGLIQIQAGQLGDSRYHD
jgi:hypothetical protein